GGMMHKVMAHVSATPQPIGELRPEVPEGLRVVLTRMMAKDPAKRYQTAGEVAQALTPFAQQKVVDAVPPAAPPPPAEPRTVSLAPPPAPAPRRAAAGAGRRWLVAAVVLGIVGVLAGGAVLVHNFLGKQAGTSPTDSGREGQPPGLD